MCPKLLQLCLTLWHPMDYSLPGSSVHGDPPGKNFWGGLPCLPPAYLPDPGIEPMSLMYPVLAAEFFATSASHQHNRWKLLTSGNFKFSKVKGPEGGCSPLVPVGLLFC